jgi:hypothetical protein
MLGRSVQQHVGSVSKKGGAQSLNQPLVKEKHALARK